MQTVAARKTTVKPVAQDEAFAFVERYHRQGLAAPGKGLRSYGLYHNDELLAVAIFCNPRTAGMQRKYTTELFRMAFKEGVRIQGGASKLIKHFLSTGPWDLFTYQDTSGKATDVYAHSGLTLAEEAKPKQVLVLNGLTFTTAKNNRRDWFSMEQVVRFGPDSLIGTELGERFHDDGTRKTNVELFLEHCGYHLEDVPGDRVYAWRNPAVKFYVYKITSSQKPGYYIGRHLTQASATLEECLADGYMGSGGARFQNWLATVDPSSLLKEIVGFYSNWESVVRSEEKLIGDRHVSDPLCLNTRAGGTGLVRPLSIHRQAVCAIHGMTTHFGESCKRCSNAKAFKLATCPIHGETQFQGDACARCRADKLFTLRECAIHGETIHMGVTCKKCASSAAISTRDCPIHGETTFMGELCKKCAAAAAYSTKQCTVHGETLHVGDACKKCAGESSVSLQLCSIHGETKHHGKLCSLCQSATMYSQKECPKHGLTSHMGYTCKQCVSDASYVSGICPVHGEVQLHGTTCKKCVVESAYSVRECPTHGLTKHYGTVCKKCSSAKSSSTKECPVHGLSKHRGDSCFKCAAAKRAKKKSEATS